VWFRARAVKLDDAGLVRVWLRSKFESDSCLQHALDEGALRSFPRERVVRRLAKGQSSSLSIVSIFKKPPAEPAAGDGDLRTLVDPYWLTELVKTSCNHVRSEDRHPDGARCLPRQSNGPFGTGGRASWSYAYRPAV